MTREARHTTSDIVTVFARQGIAMSTIARALAMPADRVENMCLRAHEHGELQMLPPASPDDPRHSLLVEVTNLRVQLDDAQEQIRDMLTRRESAAECLMGVAGLTVCESKVLMAIAKYGRATKSNIYHVLYGASEVDREPKIVDVLVCKVRKKMRPHNITIETIWGAGYSMDAENKARLMELAGVATLNTVDVPRIDSPSLQPAMVA